MSNPQEEIRKMIIQYGQELYDRKLTDAAGGNISVRVDNAIFMTPRYAGNLYHWMLRPEQILTLDLEGNKLDGEGETSRETKVHIKLLNEFYPNGTAVIHAHARNILVFCAAMKPIPPVLHATMKYGEIQHIPETPAHTQELANNIAECIRGQEERIRMGAAAVMAPKHGIFALGKDLNTTFDAIERIDTNAFCILQGKAFGII